MYTQELDDLCVETAANSMGQTTGMNQVAESEIVIIDDEPLILELYEHYLSTSGFKNIRVFSSSVDAIESLKWDTPDLVFTDINMPGVNGNFLVRLIRRYPRFALVPVIAITSDTSDETRDYLMEHGASAVVHKPIDAQQICAIANAAIG